MGRNTGNPENQTEITLENRKPIVKSFTFVKAQILVCLIKAKLKNESMVVG